METMVNLLLATLDILLVAFVIYRALLLIQGTAAMPVLVGLGLVAGSYFISRMLGLATFNWLVGHFLTYSFLFGVIVLFQQDIRRGLARLGRNSFFGRFDHAAKTEAVDEVVSAVSILSASRTGALVVLERMGNLDELVQTGVRLDAQVSSELLVSLFFHGTPLHDGAAVIQHGRVAAAKCVLPLSDSSEIDKDMGTRHRAALGLSEEVDAAVVVVSEERGEISLAAGGRFYRDLNPNALRRYLIRLYGPAGRSQVELPAELGPVSTTEAPTQSLRAVKKGGQS